MKNLLKNTILTAVLLCSSSRLWAGSLLPVVPGQNVDPISSVTYITESGEVTQNSDAGTSENVTSSPVTLKSITLSSGKVLQYYNFGGATVQNFNIASDQNLDISIVNADTPFNSGYQISDSNVPEFIDALEQTMSNGDILNYMDAGENNTLEPYDYDLMYNYGLLTEDHILVAERNGNTHFQLMALDENGNVITDANVLDFGNSTTSTAYSLYDWNSGFAGPFRTSQAMAFSVVSVEKFFEGTTLESSPQPIFGFRIDNNGEADVKFFGISEDIFTDNPIIPEVNSLMMVGIFIVSFGIFRLRKK